MCKTKQRDQRSLFSEIKTERLKHEKENNFFLA